jgi:helix-turn-helix protein
MATVTPINVVPHTRIENSIIATMAEIGVYPYAVYSAIKMHLNQATGACFPSYATIARLTGIHRSTVIECVKTLTARKLISPHWRYKEDGSHASNQYNFHASEKSGASKPHGTEYEATAEKSDDTVQTMQGSRPERLPVVAQDDPPSRPEPPEQVLSSNKEEERTSSPLASLPTEKQQTCQHPPSEIVYLTAENIRICHHCFGLLDENLTLITAGSAATAAPEHRASAECEVRQLADEPETKQPPVGNIPAKTEPETPLKMARKSCQIAVDEGKTERLTNSLVLLGKLIIGTLKAS